jgi:thiamine-phosphate pyrophosphorylase
MKHPFDPRLYLVTDSALLQGRDLVATVLAAVHGGVTMVQLREKELGTHAFIEKARVLKEALSPKGIPLIINDRVDVALACKANGVHVGQNDMHPMDVRALMGPAAIIGWSLESVKDAKASRTLPVDYVAISPVFGTPTKTDTAPALGLDGVRAICQEVSVPTVAIGGINHQNLRAVLDAGVNGVAVISAILAADDPEQAARTLLRTTNPITSNPLTLN